MTEFNAQVFEWINQAVDVVEQQQRIKTIHSTIGQVLLTKYQDLTQEIEIAKGALTDLGLFKQQEPQEDPHITARQYEQICEELGVSKGLRSHLWSALKRQTITNNRWPGLFDDQSRLNIHALTTLVNSQQLYGYTIGAKSRRTAERLVDHFLELQDRDI